MHENREINARRYDGIVSPHCWTGGFLNPAFCTLTPISASTPPILGKSRMRKRARTDLCGGDQQWSSLPRQVATEAVSARLSRL